MRKLSQIPLEEIKFVTSQSKSYSEVLRKLDVNKNGGNVQALQRIIVDNNVSVSHFTRQSNFQHCLNCGKEIPKGRKYCSNKCQVDFEYKTYIERWKCGEISGGKGVDDISNHVRRYLFEKYQNSCQICGWNKLNPYTGSVPLQVHHIDGDCTNNQESNLQLLCPNCHALTENFGSRNENCTRKDKRVR